MVEELLNDRQLIPDDTPPLPGETVHKNRPIPVQTLFGPITLKRRYLHHANSHSGRAPLDLTLDLVEQAKRLLAANPDIDEVRKETAWGEAGAENILQLRCLLRSPHFKSAWQARRPIIAAHQAKARRWPKAS